MNGSYAIWAWSCWKEKDVPLLSVTAIVQNTKKTLNEGKAIVTVWLRNKYILMNSIVHSVPVHYCVAACNL